MFVEGLSALLAGDVGIKAIVGTSRKGTDTGIYPNVAPDQVLLPYIVYTKVSFQPVLSYQGVNRFQHQHFQFSCYAGSYKVAKQLASAVQTVLNNFTGLLSDGSVVGQIIPLSEHDEAEPVFKATVYGVILDYEFLIAPTD